MNSPYVDAPLSALMDWLPDLTDPFASLEIPLTPQQNQTPATPLNAAPPKQKAPWLPMLLIVAFLLVVTS